MKKNYFAALEYRTSLVLLASTVMLFFSTVLTPGLFSATASGIAAAISPLLLIVPGIVLANRLHWSSMNALLIPGMFPIFYCALVNSAFATLSQRGIRWRETFYPLEQLRAGDVR